MNKLLVLFILLLGVNFLNSCDYIRKNISKEKEPADSSTIVVTNENISIIENVPSLDILQRYVNQFNSTPGARIIGLHKKGAGEYNVITNEHGEPFPLYKLESGKWVIGVRKDLLGYTFIVVN